MVELLTQYFIQHKEVVLPGIGQLQATPVSAKYDASRQMMLPPSLQFQWQPKPSLSTQPLMGFISLHSQLSEEESFDAVNDLISRIKDSIEQNEAWIWPGVGKLVAMAGGKIGFVPDSQLETYFTAIDAPRISHAGRTHQMLVGDKETNTVEMHQMLNEEEELAEEGRWWIPSLLLGTVLVLLIISRLGGWL
jgi:hypothetical protein